MPNVSVPVAIQHKQEIIERLSSGELVRDIAASLGVHRMSITGQLSDDPEYKAAIAEALEARLERAETSIDSAEDGLALARAREQATMARWRAERMLPHKYGQMKQAIQVNSDGPTSVKIVSWSETDAPGGG